VVVGVLEGVEEMEPVLLGEAPRDREAVGLPVGEGVVLPVTLGEAVGVTEEVGVAEVVVVSLPVELPVGVLLPVGDWVPVLLPVPVLVTVGVRLGVAVSVEVEEAEVEADTEGAVLPVWDTAEERDKEGATLPVLEAAALIDMEGDPVTEVDAYADLVPVLDGGIKEGEGVGVADLLEVPERLGVREGLPPNDGEEVPVEGPDGVGVAELVGDCVWVTEGVAVGEGDEVGVLDPEAPDEIVFVGVGASDKDDVTDPVGDMVGVNDGLAPDDGDELAVNVELEEGVLEGDPPSVEDLEGVYDDVPDLVPLIVTDGVIELVGVPESEEPPDAVGVWEGVGEGEGITTPITKMGEAYMVPAFVTGFHTLVVNTPAATPVHTLAKDKIP